MSPAVAGRCPGPGPVIPGCHERSRVISKKVFVGNLPFTTTQDELSKAFSEAGEITDVYIPTDRETGRPRGFAFVTFSSDEEAEDAIERFDGLELGGRQLRVNPAEERRSRGPGPTPDRSGPRFAPGKPDDRPYRPKGSRRGARGKKRSL